MLHHLSRLVPYVLVFVLAFAAETLAGSSVTARDVVDTLEQGYAAISDLQADFSQRTTISSLNREDRGSGELFIRKAGGAAMFRFNYTKPRQQIISNGKSVWYYLPDNKQVMISDTATLFEGGNGVALNYLTGLGHISADFTATIPSESRGKKGDVVLDLVPKKKNPVMAKLRLTVSAKAVEEYVEKKVSTPFPIVSSVMYDQLGNRTRIDFSRVRVNQGLGTDRFNFKVPAGVEVIKTR